MVLIGFVVVYKDFRTTLTLNSQDFINNSPYSLSHSSHVSLENLVLDQLIVP